MVWIAVRVKKGDDVSVPMVYGVQRDPSGSWETVTANPALDRLIKDAYPSTSLDELVKLHEFKANVRSAELAKVLPLPTTSVASAASGDALSSVLKSSGVKPLQQNPDEITKLLRGLVVQVRPAIFRGTKDPLEATTWLEHFELSTVGRTTVDRIGLLRDAMEAEAKVWYYSTLVALGTSATWDSWRAAFLAAFPTDRLLYAEKARAYVFGPGKSLTEFVFEKRRLLLLADPTATDRSLVHEILLGMPFYLRQQFKIHRPQKVEDLIRNLEIISVRDDRPPTSFSSAQRYQGARPRGPPSLNQ